MLGGRQCDQVLKCHKRERGVTIPRGFPVTLCGESLVVPPGVILSQAPPAPQVILGSQAPHNKPTSPSP